MKSVISGLLGIFLTVVTVPFILLSSASLVGFGFLTIILANHLQQYAFFFTSVSVITLVVSTYLFLLGVRLAIANENIVLKKLIGLLGITIILGTLVGAIIAIASTAGLGTAAGGVFLALFVLGAILMGYGFDIEQTESAVEFAEEVLDKIPGIPQAQNLIGED